MTSLPIAIQAAYFSVLAVLALFGLHRLGLVWILARARRGAGAGTGPDPDAGVARAPAVTVQRPIYNERYVVERLLSAACALRYPRGLLEIQVLDDSDDGSSDLAARLVSAHRLAGHDIYHIRRARRTGYKAGALAHGLASARGELVAVFDADFVPPRDFLERAVPAFSDPRVGMAQARWGHLNRDYSTLTRAQALMLDGHFVVEHGARQAAGRFLNFNGTAGMFRRDCIEEAGGWKADTLTEDLDLSYRAQLAGWRFVYLPDLVVPAELPVELNALKSQQRRWAKGSIQTALKLLPRILAAPLPWRVKAEAAAHLTNNAAYLLLLLLALLIVPALEGRAGAPLTYLVWDLPLFAAGTGSFAVFCAAAQRRVRTDWPRALIDLPAVMAVGIGLSLNNGVAVLSALARRRSEFRRTPKFHVEAAAPPGAGAWTRLAYRAPQSRLILLEAGLAVYFAASVLAFLIQGRYPAVPFLLLFAGGFGSVTAQALSQQMARDRVSLSDRSARAPAA